MLQQRCRAESSTATVVNLITETVFRPIATKGTVTNVALIPQRRSSRLPSIYSECGTLSELNVFTQLACHHLHLTTTPEQLRTELQKRRLGRHLCMQRSMQARRSLGIRRPQQSLHCTYTLLTVSDWFSDRNSVACEGVFMTPLRCATQPHT